MELRRPLLARYVVEQGQGRLFNITGDIRDEARIVERAFELCPCARRGHDIVSERLEREAA